MCGLVLCVRGSDTTQLHHRSTPPYSPPFAFFSFASLLPSSCSATLRFTRAGIPSAAFARFFAHRASALASFFSSCASRFSAAFFSTFALSLSSCSLSVWMIAG